MERYALLTGFGDNVPTRDATKRIGRSFIKSPVAFTHHEVQTPQNRDYVADHATRQKLR